jgi:hypothetical protein
MQSASSAGLHRGFGCIGTSSRQGPGTTRSKDAPGGSTL